MTHQHLTLIKKLKKELNVVQFLDNYLPLIISGYCSHFIPPENTKEPKI